jgi:hypothetical protein
MSHHSDMIRQALISPLSISEGKDGGGKLKDP